jgi:hypothetical protein
LMNWGRAPIMVITLSGRDCMDPINVPGCEVFSRFNYSPAG